MATKSKLDRHLEANMKVTSPVKRNEDALNDTLIGRAASQVEPTTMLRLEKIQPSPFQSRGEVDEAHIEELMASIEQEGVLVPLLVRPVSAYSISKPEVVDPAYSISRLDEAAYEIIAGHNRFEALRRLGRTHAPTIVRQMSDAEAARALTSENALHKALADWELFKHIKMLRMTKAASNQRELAKILACSPAKVAFLEHFEHLPDATKAILDRRPDLIGYNLMRDLKPYAISNSDVVEKAIQRVADGKLTQGGVVTWIKKQVEKPQPVFRKEVALEGAHAVYTEKEARIVSDSIDFEKLHALIEANLHSIRKTQ